MSVWMTPRDIADRYGVSLRTVEDWRYHRRGPRFAYIGRAARYRLDDVLSYEDDALKASPDAI